MRASVRVLVCVGVRVGSVVSVVCWVRGVSSVLGPWCLLCVLCRVLRCEVPGSSCAECVRVCVSCIRCLIRVLGPLCFRVLC